MVTHLAPPPETLAALFEGCAPTEIALRFPDEGEFLTVGTLVDEAARLAGILKSAGIERGDRVAIVLPDGPAFLRALLAVTLLGAAAAPLNPAYTTEEYGFYLADLQPQLLLLPPGEIPNARSVAEAASLLVADFGGVDSVVIPREGRTLDRPSAFDPAVPDDVGLLLHTSGTTSRPKQVPLLHRNLVASARAIARHYALSSDDVSYCAMPLFHVHGLVASVFAALAAGGTCVVPRRFVPRLLLDHLVSHDVTWFSAGPTLHQMVLARAGDGGAIAAPRLRFLRSCSSALPPQLMGELEDRYGVPVLEAYGMTEASHQISANPLPPAERKPGSVGVAAGADIAILGPRGTMLDVGEPGEVVIRGTGVTPGYLNNPEANADSFHDGWFRTGDIGSLDADGYLTLVGRLKEMIIRGGENISPYEVEEALLSHPAVVEAVCFGLPDDKYGEEVAAAVSLAGAATAEELSAHCRKRLAAFKVPKKLHIVDVIPRTATGKVQRQRMPAFLGLNTR